MASNLLEENGKRRRPVVRARRSIKTELGARIRAARKLKGLSQAELARLLGGLNPSAVGQWELGLTEPGKQRLVQLSEALDLPLEALLRVADWGKTPETAVHATSSGGSARTGRTAVDLDAALVAQARHLGIDVPTVLDGHLRDQVAKVRGERWLEGNRDALADANGFLMRHGLWSDGKRQF
jgi:antitoxin CcdA